jgi:hypothetical protein
MHAAILASKIYSALAILVLFLHALFILWVVFGALLTRSRPTLRWLHIGSLVLGNSYGTAPLAVSVDGAGELARTQRRSRARARRVLAPLLGQAGLSGHFANHVNNCGGTHLRSESCVLWPANLDHSISLGAAYRTQSYFNGLWHR